MLRKVLKSVLLLSTYAWSGAKLLNDDDIYEDDLKTRRGARAKAERARARKCAALDNSINASWQLGVSGLASAYLPELII